MTPLLSVSWTPPTSNLHVDSPLRVLAGRGAGEHSVVRADICCTRSDSTARDLSLPADVGGGLDGIRDGARYNGAFEVHIGHFGAHLPRRRPRYRGKQFRRSQSAILLYQAGSSVRSSGKPMPTRVRHVRPWEQFSVGYKGSRCRGGCGEDDVADLAPVH